MPLQSIQSLQLSLEYMQATEGLFARAQSMTAACMRLNLHMDGILAATTTDTQLQHEHASHVVAAAAALDELHTLTNTGNETLQNDISQLKFLQPYLTLIPEATQMLRDRMESLLLTGLRYLSPHLLSSAMEAANNLDMLPNLVCHFIDDLNDVLIERTQTALDLLVVGKELGQTQPPIFSYSQAYRVRRGERLAAQLEVWSSTVLSRIRGLLLDEMAPLYSKVHLLERVLHLKRVKGQSFFIMVASHGGSPSTRLCSAFANDLERIVNESIKDSDFWHHIFVLSYPNLLHIFQELFTRLSIYADGVDESLSALRRWLAKREQIYITTIVQRWTEARQQVRAALTSTRFSQATVEAQRFIALIVSDLEACANDERLFQRITAAARTTVAAIVKHASSLLCCDENAFTLQGSQATSQQLQNMEVARLFRALYDGLNTNQLDGKHDKPTDSLQQALLQTLDTFLLTPMFASVQEELATVLSRIYRFRLDKPGVSAMDEGDTSSYMLELCARLFFFRSHLLNHLTFTEITSRHAVHLASHTMCTFVMHASLMRLAREEDKLQLVNDMTTLELALTQMLTEASRQHKKKPLTLEHCGEPFRALRSFRLLLFEPLSAFEDIPRIEVMVPNIIAVQHLISRSTSLPLPSELRRMNKPAYVDWAISSSLARKTYFAAQVERAVAREVHTWLTTHASNYVATDSMDKNTLNCLLKWDKYLTEKYS